MRFLPGASLCGVSLIAPLFARITLEVVRKQIRHSTPGRVHELQRVLVQLTGPFQLEKFLKLQ